MPQTLTCRQSRAVDRYAMERLGVSGLVLMENAGRGCVDWMEQIGISGPVVICCGKGNNGGDGYVMARQLMVRGYQATVLALADPESLQGDAAVNAKIWRHLEGRIVECGDRGTADSLIRDAEWIVDAMLGTGTSGAPRSPFDEVIRKANRSQARRLAIDLPSGLDGDSGEAHQPTFRATHTATMVAPKTGLLVETARPYVGRIQTIDIGIPLAKIALVDAEDGLAT